MHRLKSYIQSLRINAVERVTSISDKKLSTGVSFPSEGRTLPPEGLSILEKVKFSWGKYLQNTS